MRKVHVALVVGGVLLAVALLAPALWRAAQSQGYHIPGGDGVLDWYWGLAWAPVLAATLFLWPVPRQDRRGLFVLWGAKVAVALGFMLYYEQHYGALDAFGYYSWAVDPAFDPSTGSPGDATSNMMVLSWILTFVAPDSYHAIKATYAYIGLVAVYLFYRAGCLALGQRDTRLLLFLGLFPSVLFWSSILGKDPVALLGISLATLGAALLYRRGWWGLLAIALSVPVFVYFRTWLLPLTVAPTVVAWLAGRVWRAPPPTRRATLAALAAVALLGAVATIVYVEGPQGGMVLQKVNYVSRSWDEGGSGQTPPEFTSIWVVLAFLPWGMFTAVFRPLPGDLWNSAFGVLAGLENLALLAMVAYALWRARFRALLDRRAVWVLAYVGAWATIYAFVSYQNLGTGFRFRLQVLPAILLLVWALGVRDLVDRVQASRS